MDSTPGAGLASSTGIRPYLPPLLAGALARGDVGIDFDGTDFSFLESSAFLAAILALAVVAFLVERSAWHAAREKHRKARDPFDVLAGLIGMALGALLFAGVLADNGEKVWIGLLFGPLCAALGWIAIGGLVERVRTRLEPDQGALLPAYAAARGSRRCCSQPTPTARRSSSPAWRCSCPRWRTWRSRGSSFSSLGRGG